MDPNNNGIPANASPAQSGNSPAPGQPEPQANPQQAQPGAQPSAQTTAPDNSKELQQQLAKMQEDLKKAQDSARYFQSEKDRAAAQLQALVGAQPKQDPLAEDIQFWVNQGYDQKDAKAMVEFVNRKVGPLQEQNQRLQASLQSTTQVQASMQAAYERDPALFSDPAIANAVHQFATHSALNGQPVDPAYIEQLAIIEWANKHRPWANPQQQTQTPAAPSQFQQQPRPNLSFMGGANGYTPVIQPANQQKPEGVQRAESEIAKHFNFQQ